jgi:glutathione S-transferase
VKPVNLVSGEPEVACSPFRKMPGFRDGDFAISDSTPSAPILRPIPRPMTRPDRGQEPARTIWYEEFADTILIACMGKPFFRVVAPRFLGRARAILQPPSE